MKTTTKPATYSNLEDTLLSLLSAGVRIPVVGLSVREINSLAALSKRGLVDYRGGAYVQALAVVR
jgi:hypothetical protein